MELALPPPRGTSYLERKSMSLALAALYGAGSLLTFMSLVLPHPESLNEPGALANGIAAFVTAILLWLWGDRLPVIAFEILVLLGTLLISLGIHFAGYASGTPPYALFYLWIAVYSFSFFSPRQATTQVTAAALAHALVLLLDHRGRFFVDVWFVTWGILFVTGWIVGWLSGQVRRLAETDGLTGLRNRRSWETEITRALAVAARANQPMSVVLIDVDGLKGINDKHGHQAGDRCLKECAAAWSGTLRSGDLIARLGGDEFGILLTGSTAEGAEVSLKRLHQVAPTPFSAGCAEWDGSESPDQLLHRADLSLYENKRARKPPVAGRIRI